MSDRFAGFGEPRAFACVVRTDKGGAELLVFDHPVAGTQIPKGRIGHNESSDAAAVRELAEESGLELDPVSFIGRLQRQFDHPETGEKVSEDWDAWLFEASPDLPDTWQHTPD